MALTEEQVKTTMAMKHHELVTNAQSQDLAVVVEASLRLHKATKVLNGVLIFLTLTLVVLNAVLVFHGAQ